MGAQFQLRTTGPTTFASLPSNVISMLCSRCFAWGDGKWHWLERKAQGLGKLSWSMYCMSKTLILRQTQGSLAPWIWPKFLSKHFVNLPTPQADIQVFEATNVRFLSTKTEKSWNYLWKITFNQQIAAPLQGAARGSEHLGPPCYATAETHGLYHWC